MFRAVLLVLWRLPEPALKTQLAFKHVIVAQCTESIQDNKGQLKLQERIISLSAKESNEWCWLCTVL